jgi:hypothetical protein
MVQTRQSSSSPALTERCPSAGDPHHRLFSLFSALGGIRTHNLLIRSQML